MFYDEFLKREEINKERQYNFDIVKAIGIFFMVFCHSVMVLSFLNENSANDFWLIFADDVLGGFGFVAHAFALILGLGIVYSQKNTPKDLAKRGLKLFIIGYIFSFVTFGFWSIISGILGMMDIEQVLIWCFYPNILHFAGLALLLIALFKKLKLNNFWILVISLVLSIGFSFAPACPTNFPVLDCFISLFVMQNIRTAGFPIVSWLVCPALGMVLADIIRRIKNLDKFYLWMLIGGAIIAIPYIVCTCVFGFFFTSTNTYFGISTLDLIGLLSVDAIGYSSAYFLLKVVNKDKFKYVFMVARNITPIYFIHYIIIVTVYAMLILFEADCPPYWVMYLVGFLALCAAIPLSEVYQNIKNKIVSKKAENKVVE